MKKWLIGSMVGAIILFAWQSASWMFLGLHDEDAKYTEAQDNILAALNAANLDNGIYMIPNVPPGSDYSAQDELGKKIHGTPWAVVTYKKSYEHGMTMPMIRQFLVNIFLVISFIYLITRTGIPTSMRIFATAVALGLIIFLAGVYQEHIWFQTPAANLHGHIIDALASWGLTGMWLGWWLNRK